MALEKLKKVIPSMGKVSEIYISCEKQENGTYKCDDVSWKEGGVVRRLREPPMIIQPTPEGKFVITKTGGAPLEVIDKVVDHFNKHKLE